MASFNIEWQAPEFHYHEKSVSWYWISALIAIIILGASIWQKNFLFAVFVVIAEVLILVWAGEKPRTIAFRLDEKGLTIDGKKFYPYSTISAFSVGEDLADGWREFAFRFSHGLRPLLKVRMPADKGGEAEKYLATIIQKTESKETLLDILEKLTGF
ncbi:MAG TPA: hypothetical protein VMV71_03700 [Candidatus Paceibacterota bacterium]|nr:hypothetical protein [Candidatus Paceibacterota bacterium]